MLPYVLGALLPVTLAVQPQGLSAAEKKLIHAVEGRRSDELAALEKVVNTDSGTFNTAGVREVGRYFQQELEALGFQTRRAPMPDAMHRAGHLIAERVTPKAAGKRVLLIGHLDTIFEGQCHRFERAGDTLRCAGVADMAKAVTVKGDLRFLSEGERDQAKARMLEIAAANLPKTQSDEPEPADGELRELPADGERGRGGRGGGISDVEDVGPFADRKVLDEISVGVDRLRADAGGTEDEVLCPDLRNIAPQLCGEGGPGPIAPHLGKARLPVFSRQASEASKRECP